jgi:hypothetical protein
VFVCYEKNYEQKGRKEVRKEGSKTEREREEDLRQLYL